MNESPRRHYGKFRGTVVNNLDPMQQGRIQALVPDVLGDTPSSWAMPCVPFAGTQSGLFVLPEVNAGVWIEFEQGDPDHPIWSGGWWGSAAEVPVLALAGNPASPSVVLQTGMGNTLAISDLPGPTGGFMLTTSAGAMILVNDTGITISNGLGASIQMTGPSITFNNGAMVVT
jgi:uncharacterized protein involved in type VI secretion and phage assembly